MIPPPKLYHFEAIALTALFAALVALPLVKQLTVGEPDTSDIEYRRLAALPPLAGSLRWLAKSLPQEIDAYYSDHFGFRSLLLQTQALFNFNVFNVSQSAIIGKEGWLFYKMDPPLFRQSLSGSDLAKWKSYLERRQQWLAARGVRYLFVVPPDKDSVYTEFLPSAPGRPPVEMPVDQLVRYLRETHSSVNILSLREPLLAAKAWEQQPLYYKQDGHWNSLGGFYACEAITRQLAAWFPALKPKSRADYRMVFAIERNRDIARAVALPHFTALQAPVLQPLTPEPVRTQIFQLPGTSLQPFATQLQDHDDLPRALMMCDSFSMALTPYLSQTFSRITYFWPAFSNQNLEEMMAGTILKEKPDVFIEERVQRFVVSVPDEKSVFKGVEPGTPALENP